jgi:hypothetical protein
MQSKAALRLVAPRRQDSEKSSTLLERLDAENKQLRAVLVELLQQIRAIADGDNPGLR